MQRQIASQQPDPYGQVDAMELTPSRSAASLGSSQKNVSKDQIAGTSNVKVGSMHESEPRFGTGFAAKDAQDGEKYYSNNSLMNPQIQAAKVDSPLPYDVKQLEQQNALHNKNINIMESYQPQPNSRNQNQDEAAVSDQEQKRLATISLSELQNQYNNTLTEANAVAMSVQANNEAAPQQSGFFGPAHGKRTSGASSQNFQQLDFKNIEQEEQFLEEQFNQLSQNQRLPPSQAGYSRVANNSSRVPVQPTSFDGANSLRNVSARVTYGGKTSSRQGSRHSLQVDSIEENQSTVRNADLPKSSERIGIEENNFPRQAHFAPENEQSPKTVGTKNLDHQHSMTQQSLLNRNTSPFNRNVQSSYSVSEDQPGGSKSLSHNNSVSRAESHNNSVTRAPDHFRSEENYKKLQNKIKQQAERLIQLQEQLRSNNNSARGAPEAMELQRQLHHKDEIIKELHQRNNDIAKGMLSTSQLNERLRNSEENLRMETSRTEEQRAQIAILKQGIEANLQRLGLNFNQKGNSTGMLSQIDGYLQLMRYSQINEKQHTQIQQLNDQLAHFDERHLNAIKEVQLKHQADLEIIQRDHRLEQQKSDNLFKDNQNEIAKLKQQKDDLLDFVEQNSNKMKQLEDKSNLLQCKYELMEKENDSFRTKAEDIQKQKINQDELLKQIKDNLNDMRCQREQLDHQVGSLKSELETINHELKDEKDERDQKDEEINRLNQALEEKEKQLLNDQIEHQKKNDDQGSELDGIRSKMEIWQESLNRKDDVIKTQRGQILEFKNKQTALEDCNESLKKTVNDTQAELLTLVEAHEKLAQSNASKSNEIWELTQANNRLKTNVAENKLLIEKYQTRLKQKDQEMHEIAEQLKDRNKVHLDNERTFVKDLKYKEKQEQNLTQRMKDLENQLNEKAIKLDYLDRTKMDTITQEQHLKRTLQYNQNEVDQLKRELKNVQDDYQRTTDQLEQTLSEQNQTKEIQVQDQHQYKQQIAAMQAELSRLKRFKQDKIRENTMSQQSSQNDMNNVKKDISLLQYELNRSKEDNDNIKRQKEVMSKESIKDKQELVKLEMQQESINVALNKMLAKFSKFCKQVSRVEGLDKKYAQLHAMIEVHETIDKDGMPSSGQMESITKCIELIQSQIKNLIIINETAATDTSFDQKLDLIQQDKIPQRETQIQKQKSDQNLEKFRFRNDDLEGEIKIEKDMKHQQEICLNKISQLLCLKSKFRQIILTIVSSLKSLYQSKLENKNLSSKLLTSEQRYNELLNESQNEKLFKNQMINLKQTIEKDRLQINHVERKIETVENEIAENLSKLLMEDKVANAGDEDDTVRVRALEDKINEMKSNFEEASSKKEWAEAKLLEIQAQMNLFQVNESQLAVGNQLSSRSHRSRKWSRPGSAMSGNRDTGLSEHRNSINRPQLPRAREVTTIKKDEPRVPPLSQFSSQHQHHLSAAVEPRAIALQHRGSTVTVGAISSKQTSVRDSYIQSQNQLNVISVADDPTYQPLRVPSGDNRPQNNEASTDNYNFNLQSDFGKGLQRQLNYDSAAGPLANEDNNFTLRNQMEGQQRSHQISRESQILREMEQKDLFNKPGQLQKELSMRNILMNKFAQDNSTSHQESQQEEPQVENQNQRLEKVSPTQNETLDRRQQSRLTSMKFKRDLTASRSPYRDYAEELPMDIHSRESQYIDLKDNKEFYQQLGGVSSVQKMTSVKSEFLVDSLNAMSSDVKIDPILKQSNRISNRDMSPDQSSQRQRTSFYQDQQYANMVDADNTRPLRGPRSASRSRSRSPAEASRKYLIGSNKSKHTSPSPNYRHDIASSGTYLLPLQQPDSTPSYVQTNWNTRQQDSDERYSLPLSYVQTNQTQMQKDNAQRLEGTDDKKKSEY